MFNEVYRLPLLLTLHLTCSVPAERIPNPIAQLVRARIYRPEGLGNLTVSQPSCFLWVAWQLGTGRVLQLNDLYFCLVMQKRFYPVLVVQECEGSKVFPPGDQHVHIYGNSDAAFPRGRTGHKRSAPKTAHSDRPTVDRDRWRIIQYGRNPKAKEPGAARKTPAVRVRIRNETVMPYSLRPRVRPTPCSRPGQTVESSAPGRVPKGNPTSSHCLVGQTFESKAQVGVPQPNPLPRPGQPGSISCPRSSASTDVPPQPLPTAQANVAGPFDCQSSDRRALCSTLPTNLKQNNTFLYPRDPFYIGAFNFRTLCQIGKQAVLAETLYSLEIDVCCVSETRIQDPSVVLHLRTPRMNSALSHFSLRVSGDPEAMTRGIYGVGVALSPRAERALLDWIPVNSRLCAVRLSSSIKINASRHKKRCLFVVSAYAPTDCSSDAEKDTFYRELSGLIRQAKSTDTVILAGDMDAQVGRLNSLESHLGGRFGVNARRTDNADRLLQLCADHELFLASTNFHHKLSHHVTWWASTFGHVAISHRWRATIQDFRSFWGTPLDSDHTMVDARLTVRFPSGPRKLARSMLTHYLRRTTIAQHYRSELAQQFTVNQYCGGSEHVDEA
ncbi:hypothetical protein T265_02262 [Opisthorchis viverrini]|uniref:Endonuclease/exonuclease/phosphatase domain-containing protein n=1 Tax=Opisthorchis viverrini TaxID=6198 RepID=A0A075AIE4_OPIVI|nr:hypothetical protein T265_02262 [Opisthorchis viverrini]KER31489.1 hypothetical protein T265_02262 [Opisthorchis viverrini]